MPRRRINFLSTTATLRLITTAKRYPFGLTIELLKIDQNTFCLLKISVRGPKNVLQ